MQVPQLAIVKKKKKHACSLYLRLLVAAASSCCCGVVFVGGCSGFIVVVGCERAHAQKPTVNRHQLHLKMAFPLRLATLSPCDFTLVRENFPWKFYVNWSGSLFLLETICLGRRLDPKGPLVNVYNPSSNSCLQPLLTKKRNWRSPSRSQHLRYGSSGGLGPRYDSAHDQPVGSLS